MTGAEAPMIGMEIRIGVTSRETRFAQPLIVIGRGAPGEPDPPEVDLSPDDAVSRRHAHIEWTAQGWAITDLVSTNGTWVNGRRLEPETPQALRDGDRISLGRLCVLTVRLTEEADAASTTQI